MLFECLAFDVPIVFEVLFADLFQFAMHDLLPKAILDLKVDLNVTVCGRSFFSLGNSIDNKQQTEKIKFHKLC